jgi:hypothetical protein
MRVPFLMDARVEAEIKNTRLTRSYASRTSARTPTGKAACVSIGLRTVFRAERTMKREMTSTSSSSSIVRKKHSIVRSGAADSGAWIATTHLAPPCLRTTSLKPSTGILFWSNEDEESGRLRNDFLYKDR